MNKKDMPRRMEAMELKIRRTMTALEKNNMHAYYAPTSEEAVRVVLMQAVGAKPDDHHDRVGTERGMSQIGG